ncbi:hypothetical protein M0805_002671 [Coniferiporia weirii]|nr:hypothetical protein M0805_002671 [Coniferiporia weirii]
MPDSLLSELREVPLGTGPPTHDELRVYYTPKFSWAQLRLFINAGDLGLLKRDKVLQERYMQWSDGIKGQYGSMVNYLTEYRLQWGKPDRLSLLQSELEEHAPPCAPRDEGLKPCFEQTDYFTSKTPAELISVIRNDWPYSGARFVSRPV